MTKNPFGVETSINSNCSESRMNNQPYIGYIKVLMQGKLIVAAYTLRSNWNQFSLGGVCKQE